MKPRVLSKRAFHGQLALMFCDDTVAHGQPQSSALVPWLCREEWIEDALRRILGDSRTVVLYR